MRKWWRYCLIICWLYASIQGKGLQRKKRNGWLVWNGVGSIDSQGLRMVLSFRTPKRSGQTRLCSSNRQPQASRSKATQFHFLLTVEVYHELVKSSVHRHLGSEVAHVTDTMLNLANLCSKGKWEPRVSDHMKCQGPEVTHVIFLTG